MSPIYSPGAQSSEVRWPAQSHTVVVLGSRSIPGLQVLPRLCVPAPLTMYSCSGFGSPASAGPLEG